MIRRDIKIDDIPFYVKILLIFLPWFCIPGIGQLPIPLAVVALIYLIFQHKIYNKILFPVYFRVYPFRAALVLFFVYSVLSALLGLINLSILGKTTLHLYDFDVSYTPIVLQRLFLLSMCLGVMEIMRSQRWVLERVLYYWLIGMSVAVIIHVLCNVAISDELTRKGSLFKEGNHAGLYYIVSFFCGLEYIRITRDKIGYQFVALDIVGLLLTQSSAGILTLGLTIWVRQLFLSKTMASFFRTILISGVAVIVLLNSIDSFEFGAKIKEKLFEEEITAASFSRMDRMESVNIAVTLFMDNPVIGQGLQTYGFLTNDLLKGVLLDAYDFSYRRIPNNIYAEIIAEQGVVGFISFSLILCMVVFIIFRNKRDKNYNFLAGTLGVLGYWFAFPTYTILYIWVFWGIAINNRVGNE